MKEQSQDIENPELDFYNFIVNINVNQTKIEDVLKKDTDTIYNLISKDYKKNIQIAASNGFKHAYICIYESNAKHEGIIPIDNFIRLINMDEQYKQMNIETVMERLRKNLKPFKVDLSIHNEDNKTIICIVVNW